MILDGKVTKVGDLTRADREQMFCLMQDCYTNVCRNEFEHDLDQKQWAIVVTDDLNQIRGFSTQTVIEIEYSDRQFPTLFSGDTVVAREYWGKNPLFQMWGRLALTLIDQNSEQELFWFLISKGFRTYRTLPTFFHTFWPRYGLETPREVRHVINVLGNQLFPEKYDAEAGLIRAKPTDYHLREDVGSDSDRRQNDPHFRFFLKCNPGHMSGDELCCLAPLTRENFRRSAMRVIGSDETVEL